MLETFDVQLRLILAKKQMFDPRLLVTSILILASLIAVPACSAAKSAAESGSIQIQNLKRTQEPQTQQDVGDFSQLSDGEYLIRIQSNNKSKLYCTTQLVQISSNLAEIIVQTNDSACRIVVLKGQVTVKNLADRSILHLGSGEIYETVAVSDRERHQERALSIAALERPDTAFPLFKTIRFATTLFAADPTAQLPGLTLDLTQEHYPRSASERAKIVMPPTRCAYEIGIDVAKEMPIPADLVQHFAPTGIMRKVPEEKVAQDKTVLVQ